MWLASEKTVKNLFESLMRLKLNTKLEHDCREEYMDQLGSSVNHGGRVFIFSYICSIFLLPKLISLPPSAIRIPMFILLLTHNEFLYYLGAQISIKYTASQILNDMNKFPSESQLKQLAQTLVN